MGFRMFSSPATPIAINFGSTSVKLLQVQGDASSEKPELMAAAELPLPESIRQSPDELFEFYQSELPAILRQARFKGRRVVCSLPSHQTIVQHLQISPQDGVKRDELVKGQLQMQMGIAPGSAVVRTFDVAELNRGGQNRVELICFAIARDVVMRYVSMLEKFKLQVVGMHTETLAMVRAFDHIHRRQSDANIATMYIDLGYSGTRVAVTHGMQLAFARTIQVGGRHFDQLIAKQRQCSIEAAREYRLTLQQNPSMKAAPAAQPVAAASPDDGGMARIAAAMARDSEGNDGPGSSEAPSTTVVSGERREGNTPPGLSGEVPMGADTDDPPVDLSELLDTITDELSMCLRYHHGLFGGKGGAGTGGIDRVILVGGEARQTWFGQHIARSLRIPARLGDPLSRFRSENQKIVTPGVDIQQSQPGWAVACGLSGLGSE